jgi:heterotetrameric sarcosine oxidase gamma subunit
MERVSVPDRPQARSALAGVYRAGRYGANSTGEAGVTVCERRGLAIVHLAGDDGDAAFRRAAEEWLGLGLPRAPNTAASSDAWTALWLGPGRWLLVAAARETDRAADELRGVLGPASAAVTNIGSGRTVLRIAGRNGADALAVGCPLDLHPRRFAPGQCAQSAVAGINVLIHKLDASLRFDVFVARTYAETFWDWLDDAAAGFGFQVLEPSFV